MNWKEVDKDRLIGYLAIMVIVMAAAFYLTYFSEVNRRQNFGIIAADVSFKHQLIKETK